MNQPIVQILSDPTYDPPEAILSLNLSGDLLSILNQLPKEVCVAFAVGEAKLALPIFEAERPDDDRPRKAIEAAEEWLRDPSVASASAARAARDAADAADARDAAYYAAYYAAYTAAEAAYTATAAYSAYYADRCARVASYAVDVPSYNSLKQFVRLFKLL